MEYWDIYDKDRNFTGKKKGKYEKWNEAPCNRDDNVDTVHWERTNTYNTSTSYADYDNSKTYQVGETCHFGFDPIVVQFKCIKESMGNPPVTSQYSNYPKTLGYRDSIWRLANYIEQRLKKENEFINNLY